MRFQCIGDHIQVNGDNNNVANYCIAGYFQEGNFSQVELSQFFMGKIFTNCHRLFRVKFSRIELNS